MSETFKQRRQQIIEKMPNNSLAVFFASDLIRRSADATYDFSVNRNFYYLCNCDEDGLILFIVKTEHSTTERLFIKDYNPTYEKWVGHSLKSEDANKQSGIERIHTISEFDEVLAHTLERNPITSILIDAERNSLNNREIEGEKFAKLIHKTYPAISVQNINHTINALRTIKSKQEIEYIKEAIHITQKGIERLLKDLKPGKLEYEVVADFNYQLALDKADNAFGTIAASGANACILHYVNNGAKLLDNTLILLDLGAAYRHYNADITRTFPVNGKFNDRQKIFYQIVLDAQNEVIKSIKPGLTTSQLNEIVKKHYAKACVAHAIIDSEEEVSSVYYHGVSHFLGLDTHDVGQLENILLKPGMVITVEPGLYSSKEGIGIRIEDDVLVTETGCEVLSKGILKTIEDIEKFMHIS